MSSLQFFDVKCCWNINIVLWNFYCKELEIVKCLNIELTTETKRKNVHTQKRKTLISGNKSMLVLQYFFIFLSEPSDQYTIQEPTYAHKKMWTKKNLTKHFPLFKHVSIIIQFDVWTVKKFFARIAQSVVHTRCIKQNLCQR